MGQQQTDDGMIDAKHQARHQLLHRHLDELFADYITNNPNESTYTGMPFIKLMKWSAKQVEKPDHPPQNV